MRRRRLLDTPGPTPRRRWWCVCRHGPRLLQLNATRRLTCHPGQRATRQHIAGEWHRGYPSYPSLRLAGVPIGAFEDRRVTALLTLPKHRARFTCYPSAILNTSIKVTSQIDEEDAYDN